MVDDSPDDPSPSPDAGRARRDPPTIDLEASEVTTEPQNAGEAAPPEPLPSPRPGRSAFATGLIAALSGAAAAALVIALSVVAGWPEVVPAPSPPPTSTVNSAAIDDLATRLAGLEAKTGKPVAAAPDPATVSRLGALEKSVADLRAELDRLRAQSEKLAGAVSDVKSAPRDAAPPPADLTGINDRIAGLERAIGAQKAELTQESAKPADDVPLRRVVAAALLDVLVRIGDPYPAALEAAKSLSLHPEELKPLEPFATTGVPNAANLCRELLTLVPKLSPPAPATTTSTGSGIVERLEAGAAKLVRIERTDVKGNDRDNVVARVTAAALRNDVNEARRELNMLTPADRAPAQGWVEKADARDTALALSRQFAAGAMTALAKPSP